MNSKEMRDYLKEHYGFNFPMKAKYKRNKNRPELFMIIRV